MSLLSSSSLWWLVPPIPTWLALSVVMVTLLWYQLHRKYYTYFDRHGIPQTRRWAVFPFGHLVGVRLLWSSLSDLFIDTYAEFNDRRYDDDDDNTHRAHATCQIMLTRSKDVDMSQRDLI